MKTTQQVLIEHNEPNAIKLRIDLPEGIRYIRCDDESRAVYRDQVVVISSLLPTTVDSLFTYGLATVAERELPPKKYWYVVQSPGKRPYSNEPMTEDDFLASTYSKPPYVLLHKEEVPEGEI
jgi:hypothetical protein